MSKTRPKTDNNTPFFKIPYTKTIFAISLGVICLNLFLPIIIIAGGLDQWSQYGESFGVSSGILSFFSIILILLSLHEQSKTSSEIAENQKLKISNFEKATSISAFQAIIDTLHKNATGLNDAIQKSTELDSKSIGIEKYMLISDYIDNCRAEICRLLDGFDDEIPKEESDKLKNILVNASKIALEEKVPVKAVLSHNNQKKIADLEQITNDNLKAVLPDAIYNVFSIRLSGEKNNTEDMDYTSLTIYNQIRYLRNEESWSKNSKFSDVLSNSYIERIALEKKVPHDLTLSQDVLNKVHEIVKSHAKSEDHTIFKNLKNWRNDLMAKEKIKHYFDVFTNEELFGIVNSKPTTDEEFEALPLSYKSRAKKYKQAILDILKQSNAQTN